MPNDKSKIIRRLVDVYISAAGADHSDGSAAHTILGWCKGGSIKISKIEEYKEELHDDTDLDLGGKYKLEAMAMETTLAQITALEAFKNTDVDIVLINRADRATGEVLASGTLALAPEWMMTLKESRKVKFEVTFSADNFTDFYSELTGATGYN